MTRAQRSATKSGSAMVELVLFLTFLVPVLLYGNYITDALFFGLKAQEAAAAAGWDMTGRLLHDYDNYDHASKYTSAANDVNGKIQTRYAGLDVWQVDAMNKSPTFAAGAGAKAQLQAMSGGKSVECKSITNSNIDDPSDLSTLPLVGGLAGALLGTVNSDLHQGGLISCQAQVDVANQYLGQPAKNGNLMKGGQDIWPTDIIGKDITLCAFGTAQSGSCSSNKQAFVTYTDDWGLAQDESTSQDDLSQFPDDSEKNKHFVNLGQVVYEAVYPPLLQTGEAAAETAYIDVDPVPILDEQFTMGVSSHNAYNLAEDSENKDGEIGNGHASLDDKNGANSYEGTPQTSNTWPMRTANDAGDIKANAYLRCWNHRDQNSFLGINGLP